MYHGEVTALTTRDTDAAFVIIIVFVCSIPSITNHNILDLLREWNGSSTVYSSGALHN
jgi:hypothetical protein